MSENPLANEIRAAIERELAPTSIEIFDDSARHAGHAGAREGGPFRVPLVSAAFKGRPQLERHRLVYAAVDDLLKTDIHALAIEASPP